MTHSMRRRPIARGAARWWIGAALACSLAGAPALAQTTPPGNAGGPQPIQAGSQAPSAPEWPALPATLPPYDEGLRSIVGFAEEGRGDEALLWTLAYLGQQLPGAQPVADQPVADQPVAEQSAGEPNADGDVPAPSLPQLPPAPELTETQRASLHYALAVILAGAPTSETPADPSAAELIDARERWALEEWARAEGLAGRGRVRSDANFNRGALRTWRGERGFLALLREVAASGGGAPPFPEDSPQREALIATRAEFAAGRDAALDGLRLGWERLGWERGAADRPAETDEEDLRANLEFCQRRLRQIDRLLELPPEEEPPPEQEQQEDKEDSEDSEDSQESQDSEDESSQQGESEENESEENSQQSEQDTESEGDQQSDSPSENSEGKPQQDRPQENPQDSNGEPDPESLEEREPPPAEPPAPEEDGQLDEQTPQEAPAEDEPGEQPDQAPGEQPAGEDTQEAQSGAGEAGQEPPLSEEQVMQLLRRLADIEKDQERLRALIRGAQRVPVEKDW